ncbi:4-(cytidine 5'-diphospho)-2-C-methyl-D-erythritol kinase, partial [Erysipelatoclostridium ramosum]|nr:4-(cytidine 5'-diphospho)-2-C-methyl-D-erythritol kinase [Thomasclavelia ramosa]
NPAQAGLAGGSADAAAVMRGIRDLLKLDISLEDLAQLGKEVGADVPFCIMETCALVKGIGERITPFAMPCDF